MSNKQIEEMAKIKCEHCASAFGACEQMPCKSAVHKQSEGKWTKHLDEWDCEYAKCSCCEAEFYDSNGDDTITIDMFYKFCPECGAKMKGETNDTL